MSYNPSMGCEGRYEAAIQANIKANARKTRMDTWDQLPDAKELREFLTEYSWHGFIDKMRKSLAEWGSLTDSQLNAVREAKVRMEAQATEKKKARADQLEADQNNSEYVGEIKQRRDWKLVIERVVTFEGQWGLTYFNICRDEDQNVVICKGTICLGDTGDTWEGKATVKSHDVYNGVKQTIINRPK